MKEYVVTIGGLEHTMQLDDVDAARYGDAAKAVSVKSAEKPQGKSRGAANKEA